LSIGYRIADSYDFVTVRYFFNPEAKNLAPPVYSDWNSSDWHKDRIQNFPKKLAYFNNTKQWAASWLTEVKAGFNGKLAVTRSHTPRPEPVSSGILSTENRLKQLDGLLEKKLITPQEYQERRKIILDKI
jgi:hypothetical protein